MEKKKLLHNFRTQGILDAAKRVIAAKGLSGATMEQIAEEADISKATIYLYFKSKEALYFHCVIKRFDEILEKMKQEVAGSDSPLEKLRSIVAAQLRAVDEDRGFFRVYLTESISLFLDKSTEFGQEFAKRHDEYMMLVTDVLKKAGNAGVTRPIDPVKATYLLFYMIRGLALCKLTLGADEPLSEDVDLVMDVFLNGIAI